MDDMDKTIASLKSWRERNPLRVWRTSKDLSQGDVAALLGLSWQCVRDYERGGYSPTSFDAVTSVAKLLGRSSETLQRQWRQWLGERPGARAS